MNRPRQNPPLAPIFAVRASLLYRLALGLVAVTMAVLPCIYVALTVLTAWGTYLFATRYFMMILDWPIPAIPRAVCAVTPLLTGIIVSVFMVKPLFARLPTRTQPLALTPQAEPRVHALVQEVCRTVGAPMPKRIELSCAVNASAHIEPGLRGFFRNQLVLTLGLPLVVGLSQRELASVVAHEFGHFRQGAGIRVSILIRSVNHWFARVIYLRDGWDVFIARWAEHATFAWMSVVVMLVRAGVGFSRGVLWLLMKIGQTVSAALMRQMEYDADRCEIGLAGSETFEAVSVKLAVLDWMMTDVFFNMARSWRSKFQLPDNLPVLIEYRTQHLTVARRAQLENEAIQKKVGLLDTHPSTADRVRRARRLALLGLTEIGDAPARELFESFDGLSRLVTLAHYQDNLNVPIQPGFLIPLEQLLRAEMEKAAVKLAATETPAAPGPPEGRVKVPMMAYDPSKFRGKVKS